MKLIPRNYDLFADVFDDMFNSSLTRGVSSIMKTDIHEKDGNYVVDVELPGYKKEDIGIDLKNGYLSISAKHETNETEKNEKGYVIHEERSFGSCSRSYYVGEYVKPEDIKAKFDNGILTLVIPNTDKKQVEASKPIMIEQFYPPRKISGLIPPGIFYFKWLKRPYIRNHEPFFILLFYDVSHHNVHFQSQNPSYDMTIRHDQYHIQQRLHEYRDTTLKFH